MMRLRLCLVFLIACSPDLFAQSSRKVHELKASPQTVHRGFFDASLKPVLTIDSGDIVRLETATGNPRYFEKLGVPKEKIPAELYAVYEGVEGTGRGDHTLNGPIHVNGAATGDMLEIRIRSVDLRLPIAGQGFVPGRGALPEEFPTARDRVLWLDLKNKTTEYAPGVVVPLKPFWGVIGVAPPPSMGRVSERAAQHLRRQHGQPRPRGRHDAVSAGVRSGRAVVGWRRPRGAGLRRGLPVGG